MLQQKIQDLAHEVHQKPPPLPPLGNNSMFLPNQSMVNESLVHIMEKFEKSFQLQNEIISHSHLPHISLQRYHPVAFGSRALHGVEVNYHNTKLEFLAMKWSIKHFQTYLLGCCFKVCTDNNPLTYFLTSPNMDAMKQRWINELVKYDFSLEYEKGKNNTVADVLSRISEECLSDEEAERVLKGVPVIQGDDTVFEVFKEKEEDR